MGQQLNTIQQDQQTFSEKYQTPTLLGCENHMVLDTTTQHYPCIMKAPRQYVNEWVWPCPRKALS